ncbi:MAG: DNA-binding protein [Planctomycetota bacterium]|nr:MAG: DNA-binding protein [Planctomycetota bacterium]
MPDNVSLLGFADPVSSWSHLLGAAVFLGLTLRLLRRYGSDALRVAAVLLLGVSSVFLLSMSGVYHLLEEGGSARPILRQLDHCGIFVLIAGTLTAVHLLLFSGRWRWIMIVVAWTVCALGITLKTVFFAQTPEWLGLALYLGMGWLGCVSTVRLGLLHGWPFVSLLFAGGMSYTLGAVLDFLRVPVLAPGLIGAHELFHLAVLIGLGLHFAFVRRALMRPDPAAQSDVASHA